MSKLKDLRKKSPGYRTARIFRTSACLINKKVASLGLFYGQVPHLLNILENEGCSQDELSRNLRVDRAATARILKGLEAADLITREVDENNRRRKLVYSTDKAKALSDEIIEVLREYNEGLFEGFTNVERELLIVMLDRVLANVEKMMDESGGCDDE